MNKKQGYQGFRKFSIKTRLVIALLLISIIPLAANQWLFLSYLFRSTSGKTLCFHFPDFINDQSEYGK